MKFSIAVNMTRRRPDVPMERVVAEALEMVVAAEALGFDVAWAAEHHSIEYTIAPNPLLLIMHWAEHARRIRLGTAVITAPYWNPLRAAGEIALTDILTNGRLEAGFGRGAYQYEFGRMAGGYGRGTTRTMAPSGSSPGRPRFPSPCSGPTHPCGWRPATPTRTTGRCGTVSGSWRRR